eukprot:m.137488 g.137488  ORF g.137488 m.137488 type:complete len:267 (+) comp11822_c0_seq1:81-881(+)
MESTKYISENDFLFQEYPHPKSNRSVGSHEGLVSLKDMSTELNIASIPISDSFLQSLHADSVHLEDSTGSSTGTTTSVSGSFVDVAYGHSIDWTVLNEQLQHFTSDNPASPLDFSSPNTVSPHSPTSLRKMTMTPTTTATSQQRQQPLQRSSSQQAQASKKAKRRRRKEPKRTDFATEGDFNREWMRWRKERDSNNISVQRSRTKTRKATEALRFERDSMEKKVKMLEDQLKTVRRIAVRGVMHPTQLTSADIDLIQSWEEQGLHD